ncbi:MAG: GPW/gp25 family protein [Cyanobacteria bacterium P01_D01_bin.71]
MASPPPNASPAHLGRGFAYPLGVSPQGGLQISDGEQSVRESIWLILRTRPGERLRRPRFGCRLHELAFAPLNQKTLIEIRLYVEEALKTWERRILLDEVRAEPQAELGRVDITIAYRLREAHTPGNVVYPFYLQPLGETDGA